MSDIRIRIEGCAGRITLTRPQALNAITWEMVTAIAEALTAWEADPNVALVIVDAEGDKAFCAGGDIAEMYQTGRAGDFDYGRRFWADEYRLNAQIARYPKPYVALMHGFVMGGGVGIACHGSHRIVDESAQVAMPECGIGLIPDVGGTKLLAHAPKDFGAFIGLTGYRMGPDDAIFAGFADRFVPRADWPALSEALVTTGDTRAIDRFAQTAPEGNLTVWPETSKWFRGPDLTTILSDLDAVGAENADKWAKTLRRQSPLAMAAALQMIRAARGMTLEEALAHEFRFVSRCMEHGDFLEGIRAQIIDRDRSPNWRHAQPDGVTSDEVAAMLAPLGTEELTV